VGEPRPYHQLLRSPTYRWWRPVVSLAVGVALTFVMVIGAAIVIGAFAAIVGGTASESSLTEGPGGFLAGNLLIAVGTPVAMAAVAVGFLRSPAWLVSVELRPRWDWLARVSVALVVWAVVGSLVWFLLSGWPGTGGDQATLLIVLCLLTTPLQAAGEEFLVRGWITQSVGAWFARPLPGAVVAGLVSATVFALLHGSQNAWLFGDRFVFGLVASYLVWRTGGLEAAVALHAISNISSIIPAALEGSLDDALTLTEAPVGTVALDVVMLLVAASVVVWLARRRDVRRLGPVVPESR
jgi:membrane protease YdiL (CAAX protease family)